MFRHADYYAQLIGRILVGGYFLWSGILETINFNSAVDTFINAHAPQPILFAIMALAIQVAGGIMLIVGSKLRFASLALAIYMLAAAFLYANFFTGADAALFLKDMAIVGGLLFISTTY
jgi:putative oxidoreductase